MKPVLVTGGAGYIGSHVVPLLLSSGYMPVVVDNLTTGFREALPETTSFFELDIRNEADLSEVFSRFNFAAVLHLAGSALVAESVLNPAKYYDNNVNGMKSLLNVCKKHGVKRVVFSSSSTLYGNSNAQELLTERHAIRPVNPYGESKAEAEKLLKEFSDLYDFSYVILRYFNVAGACSKNSNGQRGAVAHHIVHAAAVAALTAGEVVINGNDYGTADGTCVRDYIHVEDISDILSLSLRFISENEGRLLFNCGYGRGFSVAGIVREFQKINRVRFDVKTGPRRPGDPEYLVGDSTALSHHFKWKSRFTDPLNAICQSAFEWQKKYQG